MDFDAALIKTIVLFRDRNQRGFVEAGETVGHRYRKSFQHGIQPLFRRKPRRRFKPEVPPRRIRDAVRSCGRAPGHLDRPIHISMPELPSAEVAEKRFQCKTQSFRCTNIILQPCADVTLARVTCSEYLLPVVLGNLCNALR